MIGDHPHRSPAGLEDLPDPLHQSPQFGRDPRGEPRAEIVPLPIECSALGPLLHKNANVNAVVGVD